MRRSLDQIMPAYGDDHPGRGSLLGCHAFALEETGEYGRAAAAGAAALDMKRIDRKALADRLVIQLHMIAKGADALQNKREQK